MRPPTSHDTIQTTDPDGREVIGIRLSNHAERAWLYRPDYEALTARCGFSAWYVHQNSGAHGTVRFNSPALGNRTATVARVIAGDWERTAVRYRDGDRLNLRASNLEHVPGSGLVQQKPRQYRPTYVPKARSRVGAP